ncbi:MAG TPA: hypothetical protein VJW77_13185 [Terriglobia bacterium]|nr:hypothetical protein [Terriglobia bacterium]
MLRKYWFEFDLSQSPAPTAGPEPCCGVTAYDYEDALALLKENVFREGDLPPIRNVVEDIDISALDEKRVRSKIGIPVFRGVWFPENSSE